MTDKDEQRLIDASAQTRVHQNSEQFGTGIPSLALLPFIRPVSDLDIPRWGYAGRDGMLERVWRLQGADIVAAAIAILCSKVASTGYTIDGPDRTVSGRARPIIDYAEFGKGWQEFVYKWVQAFTTHDNGVFTELLADAPPLKVLGNIQYYEDGTPVRDLMEPRTGPVLSVAVLDSTRCERTGDHEFPVRYYDLEGRTHLYHYTRIHFVADMPSTLEWAYGYGFCALSRCLATLSYGVNWSTARNESLDAMPPLGFMTVANMNKEELKTQLKEYEQSRRIINEKVLRSLIMLVGSAPDKAPELNLTNIRQFWEGFDEQKAFDISVNMVAMAFGMDRQDLAPLSSAGLGSGAQSSVLDEKQAGKGEGAIRTRLEELMRQIMPASCKFSFDYKDDKEDMQRAQIIQTKVGTILQTLTPAASPMPDMTTPQPTGDGSLLSSLNALPNPFAPQSAGASAASLLTPEEARRILFYEVPEWADILDPDGTQRNGDVVIDELSPELAEKQFKMFGPFVRYHSKSGKIVQITNKNKQFKTPRRLPVHEVTDLELQKAAMDLADMGIDLSKIARRQYGE